VPIGEDPETRFGPPNDFKDKYRVIETEGYQPEGDIGEQTLKRFNLASKKSYRYLRPFLRIPYRFYSEVFHYPDKEKSWETPAIKVAEEFLGNEKVDAIISSSSPVTCHIVARELKNKHKITWIADLRDLWTQNHNYPYSRFRRMIERRLEVAVLSHADALVTVTPLWAEMLRDLHKGEEIYTITNGFDPERLSNEETALTSKFTITYTGQIYAGKQDPSKLLIALRDLIDDGTIEAKDVEVRFYGPLDGLLAREIERYRLSDIVQQYGIVPREVSFEKQRESQVLLHLTWEGRKGSAGYALKLFEYLAAQRPILATGLGNDSTKKLLDETEAGVYVKAAEDIKSILTELYSEYKRKGRVSYTGDVKKINKYSHREIARRFAEILDGQVHKR